MIKETLIKTENLKRKEQIKQLISKGYIHKCVFCGIVYKRIPTQFYEDGHNGRDIDMCSCGGDLFYDLREEIDNCYTYKNKPIEINGVLTNIYKEHNFKYCQCEIDGVKNEVHCGDAEFECHACSKFEEIERDDNSITFKCPKSNYNIIILKDSEEEIKQRNNEYFITPVSQW